MRGIRVLSVCLVVSVAASAPLVADVLPYWLKVTKELDNTVELGDIEQSPEGELWLLERTTGTLRVLAGGKEAATLSIQVSTACESGLLDVAFAPDYADSGLAFVSYVGTDGHLRVDRVRFDGASLRREGTILDLGATAGGCRPGGGLAVGTDGKLYVGVGDLENSASAQDDGSLAGKVLRAELDGSVPADNPSGTLVWAKGFRDGKDVALNPNSSRAGGTLYLADVGSAGAVDDEINAVREGGNYGWDLVSGDSGGAYDDPLVSYLPTVDPEGLVSVTGTRLGARHQNALLYACVDADDVREAFVTGPELDQLDHTAPFFDPDADRDGTPDSGCPHGVQALAHGNDDTIYLSATGTNPGIWRVWYDGPGAREVSAAGSPVPFTVERAAGGDLALAWERLPAIDVGRPARHGGQHTEIYNVWEGSLPITGSYDHVSILKTNGTPDGPMRLTATITPSPGNRYYLVSAQGDNMENLGPGRPPEDYCAAIGFGKMSGQCIDDFRNPVDGSPMKLTDYNPNSPTYMQQLSVADFRGRVIKLDLSADNCYYCNEQASGGGAHVPYHDIDVKYRDRDFINITVLTLDYTTLEPIPPSQCASVIEGWATRNNEATPVLCDVDLDGDNRGDVTTQFWHSINDFPEWCTGTPQNFFIDQGNVIYEFDCGAVYGEEVESRILPEINPETCE
ncbi:MAG: hypothetical protein D6718_10465 [Acidobacteria bacterium]|nr:MAG: hypothetical protein D6718_10465 [Acidobacteriota bacterium]